MKKLLFAAFILVCMSSCMTTSYYYQVYKATPLDKANLKDNKLAYEDENCKVSYNLWDEGGNIGFRFFNKTDKNIYLNLEECFFILNGESFDYFKNRVFTNSTSSGNAATGGTAYTGINYLDLLQTNKVSATSTKTSGYSVSYNEENIICIPAMTSKTIAEYKINQSLYRDCDLYKYPNKKQIKTKSFTKSNSPFVFSNRIAYSIGKSGNMIKFENEYFVSEISNYPQNEIIEMKPEEFCGDKSSFSTEYFKNSSPEKFYIKYAEVEDGMKH